MAQGVKVPAAKAGDWSLHPRAHMEVGENRIVHVHTAACAHGRVYTHTQIHK